MKLVDTYIKEGNAMCICQTAKETRWFQFEYTTQSKKVGDG